MNNMRLYLYPDPVLYNENKEVYTITDEILQLKNDMIGAVNALKAVGIAAPQLGKNIKALLVIDPETKEEYFVLNPEIIMQSFEEIVESQEGCLSFPGLVCNIKRPKNVTIKYFKIKNDKDYEVDYLYCTGQLSIIFQHEIDHLNNILLIDRMSNTQRKKNKGYFKELSKFYKKELKKLK